MTQNVVMPSERPGVVTVVAAECFQCGFRKPLTEFYKSEVDLDRRRCKVCCRARVDDANKRAGRKSMSYSLSEATWLHTLCRALPASELRYLARRPEYAKIARKAASMAARGAEAKSAADAEREGCDR